jgi:uncharacterized membrane protein YdjX (TVP38/TMEM64 family)
MIGDPSEKKRPDWQAIVPVAILVVTTLIMIVPILFGVRIFGIEGKEGVARLLAGFARSPWAGLAVMAVFAALGLTGFPQFLLIGGVAAIFGAWLGFLYSWIATMVSASLGFWLGRASGGTMLRRYGGPKIVRTSEILGERGIFASFIVRLIPSGPAVVVNMIAGSSHIRLWQFLVGTALGIIPKTVFLAFFGGSVAKALQSRSVWALVTGALALGIWVLLGQWVRRRYLDRREKRKASEKPLETEVTKGPDDADRPVH